MDHVIIYRSGNPRAQHFFTHLERNVCSFPSVILFSGFHACFIKIELNPKRIKSPGKASVLSASLYGSSQDINKLFSAGIRFIPPSASDKCFPDHLRQFLRICKNIVERQNTTAGRVDRHAIDLIIIRLNIPVIAVCCSEETQDSGVRPRNLDSCPGIQVQERRDVLSHPVRVIPCFSVRDLQSRILLGKFIKVFHGRPDLGKLFLKVFS